MARLKAQTNLLVSSKTTYILVTAGQIVWTDANNACHILQLKFKYLSRYAIGSEATGEDISSQPGILNWLHIHSVCGTAELRELSLLTVLAHHTLSSFEKTKRQTSAVNKNG